jgi:hypothetical protein
LTWGCFRRSPLPGPLSLRILQALNSSRQNDLYPLDYWFLNGLTFLTLMKVPSSFQIHQDCWS